MAQTRQTIELIMHRNKLSDRDVFIMAWKWANSNATATTNDMKMILADIKAYRASRSGCRTKPKYVVDFENYETATYMPTFSEHTWRAINRGR